jgi:hypothetical protein
VSDFAKVVALFASLLTCGCFLEFKAGLHTARGGEATSDIGWSVGAAGGFHYDFDRVIRLSLGIGSSRKIFKAGTGTYAGWPTGVEGRVDWTVHRFGPADRLRITAVGAGGFGSVKTASDQDLAGDSSAFGFLVGATYAHELGLSTQLLTTLGFSADFLDSDPTGRVQLLGSEARVTLAWDWLTFEQIQRSIFHPRFPAAPADPTGGRQPD